MLDESSDKPVDPFPDPSRVDPGETTLWTHGDAIAPASPQPEDSFPSSTALGSYRLLRKLGEGGMGQVWLAEQSVPIQRQVALKLIKAAGLDRASIQRFESERQTLALMEHPAIAKVFDAGTTPTGEPYFVMEYVAGLPITAYCDQKKMSIEGRLHLFIRVCEGVQHAHQRAIIHRDLKPSNILVAEVDGPLPRIIDFGVAKVATAEGGTMYTQLGMFVGTPGYISPEQADPAMRDVDSRTDVYSLGVILYELLAGTTPFDSQTWRDRPFHEVLRQLQEDDPPRPSTKFDEQTRTSSDIAERRGTKEPDHILRVLHGDLDWITLKALERDRSKRYATPAELAQDIQRYLNDDVVLATPPTFRYRGTKFVKRHKLAVVSAALIAAGLMALAISMSIQTVRIRRERDRANREALAGKNVSDFLVGLFRVSDPSEARGNKITAREILDKGRAEIEAGLAGQPEVQARLMGTMGNVYTNLGLLREARPLVERALSWNIARLGPAHPDTLALRRDLADVTKLEGKLGEAESQLVALLADDRATLGEKHSETLRAATLLSGVYLDEGKYSDAEQLISSSLAASRETGDTQSEINLMQDLAIVYNQTHQYDKAQNTFQDVLDLRTKTKGRDDQQTISSLQNLAYVYQEQKKVIEAEAAYRDALERAMRVLGPDHPYTLQVENNLANLLGEEGQNSEAERMHREVLQKRERVLGADHPQTLYSYNNLAGVLLNEKKYAEATKIYWDVLTKERRVLGENHPDIGIVWYNLADIQAAQGNAKLAFSYLRQALDRGYTDATYMVTDTAWDKLREAPEFKQLYAEIKKRETELANSAN